MKNDERQEPSVNSKAEEPGQSTETPEKVEKGNDLDQGHRPDKSHWSVLPLGRGRAPESTTSHFFEIRFGSTRQSGAPRPMSMSIQCRGQCFRARLSAVSPFGPLVWMSAPALINGSMAW